MKWLFDRPGRLAAVLTGVAVASLIAVVVVLALRVQGLSEQMTPGATPTPSGTALPGLTPPTGGEQGLATPDPAPTTGGLTRPDSSFATVTEQAFPDAGDPTPIAIEAVNEWIKWDFAALEDNLLPGVLEEAVANPPARDMRVDGVAKVTEPGPTQSVVTVPTNKGDLLVTCVTVNGSWMIESMGWSTGPSAP